MATKLNEAQKDALKALVVALNKLDELEAIPAEAFREKSQGIVVSFPVNEEGKEEKRERYFIKKREGVLDAIFSTESFRAKRQKD